MRLLRRFLSLPPSRPLSLGMVSRLALPLRTLLALGATFALSSTTPTDLVAQATAPAAAPAPSELQPAAAAFARGDWKRALEAYSALARKYPTHALSRFRIGVAQVELRQFAEGEASLREGERLGIAAPNVHFRLAQSFAEQGRRDEAIAELLASAAPGNFIGPTAVAADPHFASLTSHARWQEVLDAFDAIVRPCMHDPRARQFDFWIGDWDVRPVGAAPAGPPARNTVTLENNGCTIVEHWVSPSGSEGQSFNLYDSSLGQWRQTWVDNVGAQHDYRGGLVGQDMVFEGETPAPNGALGRLPTRLTFFHISRDSVRQFSEVSSDSGRTWASAYNLLYVRRAGAEGDRPSMVPLSAADRAAILAADSAFVAAWLADDATAVLAHVAPDAELFPPGAAPVKGIDAIRRYWWPADGSHTRITEFARTVEEVTGTGGIAYIRGKGTLSWTHSKGALPAKSQSSRSVDLIIYRKDASGRWRVSRQMWNVAP